MRDPDTTHLTNTQSLLWTGQRLHPLVPLYNMVLAFDIQGVLDPVHFERALAALVSHSDALRTVIGEESGRPFQWFREVVAPDLERVDLSTADDPGAAADDWADRRATRSFDLGTTLFDSALLHLAPDRWVWYLNQHHLITDGWSTALVYRRVADYYARSIAGDLGDAPPNPQFATYVEHERRFRETPLYRRIRQHWDAERVTTVTPVRLYGRRPSVETTATERFSLDLGDERSLRIRATAGRLAGRSLTGHASLFNLFATALFAYLHRVSGQQRLAIGTPTHNRASAAFKETIGVFIEVFPFLVDVDEDETFMSLLARVQAETGMFLRYAQPGASSPGANRRFSVLLNYIHASFPSFDGRPMRSRWIHPGHGDSAHHLRLQVHDFDESGSFLLHFDFNRELFTASEREAAAAQIVGLLDAMLEAPDRPIHDVALVAAQALPVAIRQDRVTAGGDEPAATVVDLFRARCRTTPDAIAVQCGEDTVTYAALADRSEWLAALLRRHGVGPDSRVGLYSGRCIEAVIGILGVLEAGAAWVPLAHDDPHDRVMSIIRDAEVRVLLFGHGVAGPPADFEGVAIDLRDLGYVDGYGEAVGPRGAGGTHGNERAGAGRPVATDAAYVLYTSGSTGRPKGVIVEHRALANYVAWASGFYLSGKPADFPLFTSLCFDLTITSLFLPLVSGGRIIIYEEDDGGVPALLRVVADDAVDAIKLTPSHLSLLRRPQPGARVKLLILGGEQLTTAQARTALQVFGDDVRVCNEYGPTEATVGCMIHRFDPETDTGAAVPIGVAAAGSRIDVVDARGEPAADGVPGEILVSGPGLARGYLGQPDTTAQHFAPNPLDPGIRSYRTGDIGRRRADGLLEYLGRQDEQVKVRGARIEPGEVEAALLRYPTVTACVVDTIDLTRRQDRNLQHCVRCGLPSSYPSSSFSEDGVCHLCLGFDRYRDKVRPYFRDMDQLRALFERSREASDATHDCVMLLSGGKDSTYALCRLVDLGVRVLAFTLDNGYLSDDAIANIRRVTETLDVEHVFGTTPAMNAIFVDSLQRYSNVCNGCFKTIYTLAVRLARERGIPVIVTGLSRGQFFETRLTEELFLDEQLDPDGIDRIVLEARKAYHRTDDAVSRLLDTREFGDDALFDDIRFVDFYRYCDASLDDMMSYLAAHVPWIRPGDTGRSTNCLINDVGIWVHTRERGYHNYAFPYSWDVRVGHKAREAALAELDDHIDQDRVRRILGEIGYEGPVSADAVETRLAAYFVADLALSEPDLRAHLSRLLPAYMVPTHFVQVDRLPLTPRGKVDRAALPRPDGRRPMLAASHVAARDPLEARIVEIWADVLKVRAPGVYDAFLDLGGNSLLAIQIISRVNQAFAVDLPLRSAFEASTAAKLAELVRETLLSQIEAMTEEEASSLAREQS